MRVEKYLPKLYRYRADPRFIPVEFPADREQFMKFTPSGFLAPVCRACKIRSGTMTVRDQQEILLV